MESFFSTVVRRASRFARWLEGPVLAFFIAGDVFSSLAISRFTARKRGREPSGSFSRTSIRRIVRSAPRSGADQAVPSIFVCKSSLMSDRGTKNASTPSPRSEATIDFQ